MPHHINRSMSRPSCHEGLVYMSSKLCQSHDILTHSLSTPRPGRDTSKLANHIESLSIHCHSTPTRQMEHTTTNRQVNGQTFMPREFGVHDLQIMPTPCNLWIFPAHTEAWKGLIKACRPYMRLIKPLQYTHKAYGTCHNTSTGPWAVLHAMGGGLTSSKLCKIHDILAHSLPTLRPGRDGSRFISHIQSFVNPLPYIHKTNGTYYNTSTGPWAVLHAMRGMGDLQCMPKP